jgi:hypothetical protein
VFCNNFNENICFGENNCSPGTIRENMCKRGASVQGCLQKFDAFAKNYLFLCKLSHKSKESIKHLSNTQISHFRENYKNNFVSTLLKNHK